MLRVLTFVSCLLATTFSYGSYFKELEKLDKTLQFIEKYYYKNISSEELIQGAIKGVFDVLDPHSYYLGPAVLNTVQDQVLGEYNGIGVELTQFEGKLYITALVEDMPAQKAGLEKGDQLININGKSVENLTADEVFYKIREGKSKVTLEILRHKEGGEPLEKKFTLIRKKIRLSSVTSEFIGQHYLLIRVKSFTDNITQSVVNKIIEFKEKKGHHLRGILFDLRDNPGGLLDESVRLASLFLKKGRVVSTESRDPSSREVRHVFKSGYKDLKVPLVVLVNGSSASAAEIFAGAIQDHKRGLIVGQRTFGKALVQAIFRIDDSAVKLTTALYKTPKGRIIEEEGIVPDIPLDVVNSQDYLGIVKKDQTIREENLIANKKTIKKPKKEKERLGFDYMKMMALNILKGMSYSHLTK